MAGIPVRADWDSSQGGNALAHLAYLDEINAEPVVHTLSYMIDEAA
jgi:hypothetical protein